MTRPTHTSQAVLSAAGTATPRMRAYIVLSLLTGARTEELRDLRTGSRGRLRQRPQVLASGDGSGRDHEQFAIYVWRSIRQSGDTKTFKSRRSLRIPARCVNALKALEDKPDGEHRVFGTKTGTAMTAENVRRDFRLAIKGAEGIDPAEWTPRELRHSFVSLLSAHGVLIEQISRLVGHTNMVVTEDLSTYL